MLERILDLGDVGEKPAPRSPHPMCMFLPRILMVSIELLGLGKLWESGGAGDRASSRLC